MISVYDEKDGWLTSLVGDKMAEEEGGGAVAVRAIITLSTIQNCATCFNIHMDEIGEHVRGGGQVW